MGALKKMFIDDIDSIELLLAHALPEGWPPGGARLVFLRHVLRGLEAGTALPCALPLGLVAMMAMYRAGTSKMVLLRLRPEDEQHHRGVHQRHGGGEGLQPGWESYQRFEQDVRGYRDFTLAWYKVCWPWMALYNSILPCVALFTLPIGAYLVLVGYSTLPDFALVLCMSFGVGAPCCGRWGLCPPCPRSTTRSPRWSS